MVVEKVPYSNSLPEAVPSIENNTAVISLKGNLND
jgi:hypothetical protein